MHTRSASSAASERQRVPIARTCQPSRAGPRSMQERITRGRAEPSTARRRRARPMLVSRLAKRPDPLLRSCEVRTVGTGCARPSHATEPQDVIRMSGRERTSAARAARTVVVVLKIEVRACPPLASRA
ncbi:hypothetical protein C8Q76DRAFT_423719 [Earliella scabrosa]|nr:hypothetical protein C8Q76DRAFT_423719 [Earliella scabrosa]